jgi:cytoskeletal protein RodZ
LVPEYEQKLKRDIGGPTNGTDFSGGASVAIVIAILIICLGLIILIKYCVHRQAVVEFSQTEQTATTQSETGPENAENAQSTHDGVLTTTSTSSSAQRTTISDRTRLLQAEEPPPSYDIAIEQPPQSHQPRRSGRSRWVLISPEPE